MYYDILLIQGTTSTRWIRKSMEIMAGHNGKSGIMVPCAERIQG